MVRKKGITKKLMAVMLSFLMVLSIVPVSLLSTAFAADEQSNLLAVNVKGVNVYFYGADCLEADEDSLKINFNLPETASEEPAVYVKDQLEEESNYSINQNDKSDFYANSISFEESWLNNVEGWIVVSFDHTVTVSDVEPVFDFDAYKDAPAIMIEGNPTEWTMSPVTLKVIAENPDKQNDIVAYSNDNIKWVSDGEFEKIENGTYSFYAKNRVGSVSEINDVVVSFVDTVAPTLNVIITPDNWSDKKIATVIAEDKESGLAADNQYGIRKIDEQNIIWSSENLFEVTEDAEYIFYAKDTAGNIGEISKVISNIDNEKPEIAGVTVTYNDKETVENGKYINSNEKYNFSVSAIDYGTSGIAKYGYSVGDSKEIIWSESDKNSFDVKLQGTSKYTFYTKDKAGNESDHFVFELKIDNEAPDDIKVNGLPEKPTNKEIEIEISAADRNDAVLQFKLDEGEWTADNHFEISDSEKHTVFVKDDTIPANETSVTFSADNYFSSKPSITDINQVSENKGWTNEAVTVEISTETGTLNSQNKTADVVSFVMDPDLELSAEKWKWNTACKFDITDCNEHKFYVMDEAGNISEPFKYTALNYDNNAPILKADDENYKPISFEQENSGLFTSFLNKLTFGKFFNERLVIKVDAEDTQTENSNVSGIVEAKLIFVDSKAVEYTFEAKNIGNKDKASIDFIVEKDNLPEDFKGSAKVYLKDSAGNESLIDVNTKNSNLEATSFMIENVAPVIDDFIVDETAVKDIYKVDYSVTFNFRDKSEIANNSGIASAKIEVNGTEVEKIDYNNEKKVNEASVTLKTDSAKQSVNGRLIENWNKGVLAYTITVIDNSGNVSSKEAVYSFDQTAPQITGFEFSNFKGFLEGENHKEKIYEAVEYDGTYGFYFKNNVTVTVSAEDITNEKAEAVNTGVKSITVYLEDVVNNKLYTVVENGSEIAEIDDLSKIASVETSDKLSFVVPKDFKGRIYAYATDNVGNSPIPNNCVYIIDNDVNDNGFCSPDGSVIESDENHIDSSEIEFYSIPDASGTQNTSSGYSYKGTAVADKELDYVKNVDKAKVPLYKNKEDLIFGVRVSDDYSGIREVSYTIIEGKKSTTKTVVIDNNGNFVGGKQEGWSITEAKRENNLVTEMANNIPVKGNYNDMVLLIELTDRAGHKSYDYYVFGIDKTAPSIDVEYDNNAGDSKSGTGTYFKDSRKATITISERNFNKENVNFNIKNAEGDAPAVKFVNSVKGSENGDDSKHIFEVTYSEDGVYSFDVNYTDRATNKNSNVDYSDSAAPKNFVIDKTSPTISVSYDNNTYENEKYKKYFKAYRTATIVVNEHNFDVNRVVINGTASIDGRSIPFPSASWVHDGDIHKATVKYDRDGDYTFSVSMDDKAGNIITDSDVNYGTSVAPDDFVIDTNKENIVTVSGIENNGNYNEPFNVKIDDINLDEYSIELTRSRVIVNGKTEDDERKTFDAENSRESSLKESADENIPTRYEKDIDVTSLFIDDNLIGGNENRIVNIDIKEKDGKGNTNDGIYKLKIRANDKAGNIYDTDDNVIVFAVNRNGSVFTISDDLYDLITENDGFRTEVKNDSVLEIYEYNSTEVKNGKITVKRNIEKIPDISVDESKTDKTDNSLNKYTYKLNPKDFTEDGEYEIQLSSKDERDETKENKSAKLKFIKDHTPSKISVRYLPDVNDVNKEKKQATAKTDKLTVDFSVDDDFRIETVEVFLNGAEDNNPTYKYTYGDKVVDQSIFNAERVENITGKFELKQSKNEQTFRIKVTDKAGNEIDTVKGDSNGNPFEQNMFFDHITVSTNFLVLWSKYPIFWVAVAAIVAAVAGTVIFISVKKNKKKDNEDTKPEK